MVMLKICFQICDVIFLLHYEFYNIPASTRVRPNGDAPHSRNRLFAKNLFTHLRRDRIANFTRGFQYETARIQQAKLLIHRPFMRLSVSNEKLFPYTRDFTYTNTIVYNLNDLELSSLHLSILYSLGFILLY